jgi:multidrug efflux pump subunit AcrB
LYGVTKVKQSFFPPATRPEFMVEVFLPAGNHIRETEAFAENLESFIKSQSGVTHVTSFIGGGGLRFLLVYSPESENRAYVQFLVDVDHYRKIDGPVATVQKHLDEKHPDANAVAKKFLLGPGAGGRIQARIRGPDPNVLRQLADRTKKVLEDDGGAMGIRHDWREREQIFGTDVQRTLLGVQVGRFGRVHVNPAEALKQPGDAGP